MLINAGNTIARPTITVYGSGDVGVTMNGNDGFSIALGDEEYITIDTEKMDAFKGDALKNRLVTGNYDEFFLNPGVNTIGWSGSVEKVVVRNYARWL